MLKELFKTDSATTLIAAIIVCVATVIAIYVLIFGSKTLLSSIMSNSLQNTGTSGLGSLGTIIS
jgi:flagellar biosynthesis protein FlhB